MENKSNLFCHAPHTESARTVLGVHAVEGAGDVNGTGDAQTHRAVRATRRTAPVETPRTYVEERTIAGDAIPGSGQKDLIRCCAENTPVYTVVRYPTCTCIVE